MDAHVACLPGHRSYLWRYRVRNSRINTGIQALMPFRTSPLYVYSSTFSSEPSHDDLLGALSLIIWSLTIIVTIKYVCIVLLANDEGEGGTFAMYNLISRYVSRPAPFHSSSQSYRVRSATSRLATQRLYIPFRSSVTQAPSSVALTAISATHLRTVPLFTSSSKS